MIEQFEPDLQFSQQFLDELNKLSVPEALELVDKTILATANCVSRYMHQIMNTRYNDPNFAGVQHAYWVDSNNLIRLKKLYSEIEEELG